MPTRLELLEYSMMLSALGSEYNRLKARLRIIRQRRMRGAQVRYPPGDRERLRFLQTQIEYYVRLILGVNLPFPAALMGIQ